MRPSTTLTAALKKQYISSFTSRSIYSKRLYSQCPSILRPRYSASWVPVASSARRTLASKATLGFDVEDNTKIINEIKNEDGETLKLKITQRAAQKLNSIKIHDKNPSQVLRIAVESGGCHGYQYILGLKDESTIDNSEDSIFERDGAKFVVDATSLEILRDSTVDYTTELIGSQFKVANSPYATSSCGCGSSFDFDPTALAK